MNVKAVNRFDMFTCIHSKIYEIFHKNIWGLPLLFEYVQKKMVAVSISFLVAKLVNQRTPALCRQCLAMQSTNVL